MAYLQAQPQLFNKTLVLSYGEALGAVFNKHYGIAVCGSHGKTTTSAWLGYVLNKAGLAPSVLVGSRVPQFQGSSLVGKSRYFVAEVDEYQNKLRYFQPSGVVLNNIDFDHPDFFKSRAAYRAVFREFIKKIPQNGFLVINDTDQEIKKIKKYCPGKIISYAVITGDNEPPSRYRAVDYLADNLHLKNNYQFFRVKTGGEELGEFKISLTGQHNVANALAVIATARRLGVSLVSLKKALASFQGTDRRTQILGNYQGAIIIDDYAHHPTEIKATLAGLKERYWQRKLKIVFHPHTFTRTKALFTDFSKSFSLVDELIVLDIYGSAREKKGGVSSYKLVKEIIRFNKKQTIKQRVIYLSTAQKVEDYLKKNLTAQDLLVLMGAGDVFRIGKHLLS